MALIAMVVIIISLIPAISAEEQRPVYVISDGVFNDAEDSKRINLITDALKVNDVVVGNSKLPRSTSQSTTYRNGVKIGMYEIFKYTESDAIIIQIMSGVCGMTLADFKSNYYKNLKGNRIVIPVWVEPAHFTGTLPGYTWFNWRTNGNSLYAKDMNKDDLNKIVADVSKKAGAKKYNSGTVKPPATTVTIGGIKVSRTIPYTLKYGIKNGKLLYSNNKYAKVTQIQLAKKVGYDGYCQGNYGNKTALYVKKLQKKEKLPQTGQVDQKTWSVLIK